MLVITKMENKQEKNGKIPPNTIKGDVRMNESTNELTKKVKELPRELLIGLGFRVLDEVVLKIRFISESVKVHPVTLETKLTTIQNLSYQVHNLTNALEAYTKGTETTSNKIDIVRDTVAGLVQLHRCAVQEGGGTTETTLQDMYTRHLNYTIHLNESRCDTEPT